MRKKKEKKVFSGLEHAFQGSIGGDVTVEPVGNKQDWRQQ